MKSNVGKFIKNPKKALITLSLPIFIGMFVQTLYNLVDTFWVGRLGAASIAAITFAFPVFFILLSLNSGAGIGASQRISRLLGEKKKAEAENTAVHGLIISAVMGLLVLIIGIFTIRPIFRLLGAGEAVLSLSVSYMSIILIGVFFMFASFMMNSIFAAQGDTRTPMKVQISALILNAILDPIFIYSFGLGVAGAAVATVISFIFSVLLFWHYLQKKSYLKVRFCCYKFSWQTIREILSIGVPASLMMVLMSVYLAVITKLMAYYGTEVVAAFGIASRLESLAIMPLVAISLSLTTLVAMFYGAKRLDLVKDMSWYGVRLGIYMTGAVAVLFFAMPGVFLGIFTDNKSLIDIGSIYMRVEVLTYPLMAIGVIVARIAQGLGKGMPGLIINIIRIVVIAIPLGYAFVYILGYGFVSVAWAMVAGGFVSSAYALIWLARELSILSAKNKILGTKRQPA